MLLVLSLIAAYLVGSIPTADLVGRANGVVAADLSSRQAAQRLIDGFAAHAGYNTDTRTIRH